MEAMTRCVFFVGILLSEPLCADDIRSWVDADGTVHFGDRSAAPENSDAVKLSPGSVVEFAPIAATPVVPPASTPAPVTRRESQCTPVMQDHVDPKTGMHSWRDTGRCEEDGDVLPADDYPYYYWGGPCNGPSCIRPPRPPLPPHPPTPSPAPQPRTGPAGTPLIPYR